MFDIITIGSAAMDVFVNTDVKTLKVRTKKDQQEYISFPLGSKILIKELNYHTGGGGTNTAVTFAKSGLRTGYLGNIGEGHNGELILKELVKHKIKFLGKVHGETGHSIILDANNDRTALVYKGCNDKIPIEKNKIKKLKAKWFYVASVTEKMFDIAKEITEKKAKICFNPSSYMTKKGLTYLRPILKNTYCLIVNSEEAELLTNKQDLLENLKLLKKRIVFDGIVIITDGKKGAYAYNNNKTYFLKASKIEVKESTGAGDAFASGFVLGIIKKHPIDFSMKMGMINAEHTIQKLGAKEGLLGKTLTHLAKADKRKVKIK